LGAPIHQSPQAKGRKPLGSERITMSSALSAGGVPAKDGYRLASHVYDAEPNPMLSLEQRFLERLVPPVAGLDVVDLGCGTGRWLAKLSLQAARTLVGVDFSPEMLVQAKRKLGDAARLVVADCGNLPFPRSSADLIVCSFLASYLQDLARFAEQVRRLLRPGGVIFVTDLHPATTSRLGWRRGFHVEGSFIDIATHSRSIQQILSPFEDLGIEADAVLEPQFGNPEFELFKRAGKTEGFQSASGHPAIYILQLSLKRHRPLKPRKTIAARTLKYLSGARVALGANETTQANVSIEGGRIGFLGRHDKPIADRAAHGRRSVDLTGFLLLPGLVNAHDHLEFALFPRLGRGGYSNFVEWADDIHRPGSSPVPEHRAVPKNTRLWWGGIRNLLCGVTTVCHHNPYVAEVFDAGFAVRVLRDFGWAHSLAMDHDLAAKRKNAEPDQPFIIHLAEGVDSQSAEEIFRLAREQVLDDRVVIVHGLGLDDRGIALLRSLGAALVWCPTSNIFLFGRTHDCQTIQGLPRVALGSDSSLTAKGDFLDEIRFANEMVGMPAEDLYPLVTTRAAQALRLKDGEGTLRIGALADFVGVRDHGLSPAHTLAAISCRDVEFVVIGGCVQLASTDVVARLPRLVTTGLRPLEIDGEVRWIRAPLERLFAETQRHLPGEIKLGGKRVRHGLPA
jgi:cytosine/adenosine deaminase-related metal-dependent hydrolase/2-polyprenyl-3-methyl-5-hydroxy-6-metoxy-1,4-benzoquinol methylase